SKNTEAFLNTFGINFGESPEEVMIDPENVDCWQKVPVIDFQAKAGETMHAFISGYLFPKVNLFNPSRWDALKNQKLRHPGLEHCALAMGPFKNSPWYIAKVLENHSNQSNGVCPGNDAQLIDYLQETPLEGFLEFYGSTLIPVPATSKLFKEVFKQERENKLRIRCLGAVIKWRKLHARDQDNTLMINFESYYMGGYYVSLRVDQGPSSEGRDHRFRAVLHYFTAAVFTRKEDCPIPSLTEYNPGAQI
ncbi:MAG: hypothetical protein GY861_28245, partial [bacterium]|nr:hypothetical protein [bacterium]